MTGENEEGAFSRDEPAVSFTHIHYAVMQIRGADGGVDCASLEYRKGVSEGALG